VAIIAALRQGPHFKIAAVASRWQRVGDLIGAKFEPPTYRTRDRCLSTCAIWPVCILPKLSNETIIQRRIRTMCALGYKIVKIKD